jgi:uncharacterized membrane protein
MMVGAFITGLLLIACGFLVKSYPDLIAGYNMLSDAEKKRVNIEGLSSLMQKSMVIIGCLIIILGVIAYFIKLKASYSVLIISGITILGIIIMIIKAQKYYPKS